MVRIDTVLIGDDPGRGSPEAMSGLAEHLGRQIEGVRAVHRVMVESASSLAAQSSVACTRAGALLERPRGLALSLAETAAQTAAQLRWYAGEIVRLSAQSNSVREQVGVALSQVEGCRQALAASGGYRQGLTIGWRSPPSAGVDRTALPASGIDDSELHWSLGRAAEAERILNSWRAVEREIDRLVVQWRRLQGQRDEVNSEMASRTGRIPLCIETSGRGYDGSLTSLRGLHGWPADAGAAEAYLTQIEGNADAIAAYWQRADASARDDLIAGASWFIGNLAGIPLADRIRANRRSAETQLEESSESLEHWRRTCPDDEVTNSECALMLPRLREETDYLRRVTSGEVNLLTFDPRAERIVEVIGDLDVAVTHAITYVPGTGADLQSFYRGDSQHVGGYLVDQLNRDPENNAVAFIYKDGPWVTWSGDRANTNEVFLAELGADLAQFEEVIHAQPGLAASQRVSVGHSAGNTVQLSAELHGASRDQVLALGGAFTPGQWRPRSDTGYFSYHYEGDGIRAIDRASDFTSSWTPGSVRLPYETAGASPSFLHRTYPEIAGDSAGDQHSRIARGPEENAEPLKHMADDIGGPR